MSDFVCPQFQICALFSEELQLALEAADEARCLPSQRHVLRLQQMQLVACLQDKLVPACSLMNHVVQRHCIDLGCLVATSIQRVLASVKNGGREAVAERSQKVRRIFHHARGLQRVRL